MRGALLALLALLVGSSGCTQLLGIGDPTDCRVDVDCDRGEFCDDRLCTCAAGYTRDATGACGWSGVVANAGFADASAWSAFHMATLTSGATDAAMKDPGFARLPPGACAATMQQRIVMPRYSRAEPLVASVTYRVPDPMVGMAAPSFGVGEVWSEVGPPIFPGTWATVRRCLGGGHYAPETSSGRGQEVTLAVGRNAGSLCQAESVEIDRFEILPANAGECPFPGQVLNGLAEEDSGWVFSTSAQGLAGFVAGAGENGSRAAKLVLQQRCSRAAAEVPLSPGFAVEDGSPALSYYVSSAGMTEVYASLDHRMSPPPVSGLSQILRFCVPAHLRGASSLLQVYPFFTGGGGLCNDLVTSSAVLDTVKLEPAAVCGTDPAIADPSFESGTLLETFASDTGSVRSEAIATPHAGSRVLTLSMSSCASSAIAYVHVLVPRPVGTAGPALKLWSLVTGGTQTTLTASREGGARITIPRDVQWHSSTLCLDPKLAGRDQVVELSLGATCTGTFATETAHLDDLSVTVEPTCPAM